MKKMRVYALALVVLSVFTLGGCKDRDDREDRLEEKIEQLEQEVTALEKQANSSSGSNAGTENSSGSVSDTNNGSSNTASDISSESIESLTTAVNDAAAKADSATPSGTQEEQRQQFFALKDELNAVEHKLDSYDDYMESLYKQGSLSYEDYRSQERELEKLEDILDSSEDNLEWTFGIDD